jgi:hypothetical protein
VQFMTAIEITLLTALISSLSAIVGVSIGSFVSLRISKRQFAVAVLSSNRQQWINTLRDTIAEFQAGVVGVSSDPFYKDDKESLQHHLEKIDRMTFLRAKATLLLNPNEEDHKKLIEMIDKVMTIALLKEAERADEMGKLQGSLTTIAQDILKREWNRVKAGK